MTNLTNTIPSFVLGQVVKYNNEHAVVTQTFDARDMVQLLQPQKGNAKIMVSIYNENLKGLDLQLVEVNHRSGNYLVSDKETIISMKTQRVMKWDANNGNRIEILITAQRANQHLYEMVADYVTFECEKDSWFKDQNLETWTIEKLCYYYEKHVKVARSEDMKQFVQQQENTMNNFKEDLLEALIAYLDSGSVSEEIAMNLKDSEDFDDMEGRLISYLDAGSITEEFGHNLINNMIAYSNY